MTAERWHQVRDILYAASQLEIGARSGYLNEVCSGDHGLRQEVDKLLLALDQSGQFLEPEPGATPALSRTLRIGPYLVLNEAGRGGMGGSITRCGMTTTARRWPLNLSKPARRQTS